MEKYSPRSAHDACTKIIRKCGCMFENNCDHSYEYIGDSLLPEEPYVCTKAPEIYWKKSKKHLTFSEASPTLAQTTRMLAQICRTFAQGR